MVFNALFLSLVASVSATVHPRDVTLEPELISTPSNYANATDRSSFVDPRSLDARQLYCKAGYHACSDQGCCENTDYCVVVQGKLGCCPNGRVCNRPPQGPPRCTDAGYFLCPSQEYCCPSGSTCTRDSNNNPKCESNRSPYCKDSGYFLCPSQEYCCPYGSTCVRDISNNPRCQGSNYSPQPTITYEAGTSTYTYESWTASTSTYSYATATPESTSAYISFPYSNSTTTTSKKSSSRESNTIFGAETTSSAQSGNGPPLLSSAQSTVPGYFVTGVMFFMVVAGLV